MSSTVSVAGSLFQEEKALKGVRRSRFSMHLNTRRARRWLLVQLVSVPVETAGEDSGSFGSPWRHQVARHRSLGCLLDEHLSTARCYRGF
jgi:hypothetical protein